MNAATRCRGVCLGTRSVVTFLALALVHSCELRVRLLANCGWRGAVGRDRVRATTMNIFEESNKLAEGLRATIDLPLVNDSARVAPAPTGLSGVAAV